MLKPPKIVITNIDEDPHIRRERKRKKLLEIGALCSIVLVNWIMVISKSCFVFSMQWGIIIMSTTLITLMYCVLVKTNYAIYFGPKQTRPHFREHVSLVQSLRWALARLAKCSTCVHNKLRSRSAILPK